MNKGGETGTPERRNQFLLCAAAGKKTKAGAGAGNSRGMMTGNHGREGLGSENRTWDSSLRNLRNVSPPQSKAGLGNLPKPHFSSQP